ncbi:hypothetical protein Pyn_00265 [Prunus yedoensis var. nudiflora]|uniref:Uncharacterized protein n=1 Tax=Prunus yedoensis var. nudiflora TaxID=2094558 RepID=A0A314XQF6_PRUYE|nr:hypothetical protein Pyn_00265 [Prunus yedoensis var. nudiflora]
MENSGAGKALNLKVSDGEEDQCHRTEEMVDNNNDTKPCSSRPNTTATATVIPPRRRSVMRRIFCC